MNTGAIAFHSTSVGLNEYGAIAFHSTSVGLNEYGAIAFHSISVGLNASLYIDLMYSKLVVCTPLNHTLPIIIAVRNDCQMNC